MAERVRLKPEDMGPVRRTLDKAAGANTVFDAVMVPTLFIFVGSGAAAYAVVSLLAGMHIRDEYIQKAPAPVKRRGQLALTA